MNSSVRISVYVQPRATRTEIAGMHDGCIKVRLAALPVDGAANAALAKFIAQKLAIAKSRVRVVAGLTSRRKIVQIDGLAEATVSAAMS